MTQIQNQMASYRKHFRRDPSLITAGAYLGAAAEFVPYTSPEYDDIKVEVGFWLQTDRLLILPDETR